MTPETAFQYANLLVLPQWVLMVVAPRWRVTQMLTQMLPIPMVLAVMYLYWLFSVPATPGSPGFDFRAFSTLAGVQSLFTGQKETVLAGWIHYLAFDLVAGSYVLRDGTSAGHSSRLADSVSVALFYAGAEWIVAVRAASFNPAKPTDYKILVKF